MWLALLERVKLQCLRCTTVSESHVLRPDVSLQLAALLDCALCGQQRSGRLIATTLRNCVAFARFLCVLRCNFGHSKYLTTLSHEIIPLFFISGHDLTQNGSQAILISSMCSKTTLSAASVSHSPMHRTSHRLHHFWLSGVNLL